MSRERIETAVLEYGSTLPLVEHDLEFVARAANQIIELLTSSDAK